MQRQQIGGRPDWARQGSGAPFLNQSDHIPDAAIRPAPVALYEKPPTHKRASKAASHSCKGSLPTLTEWILYLKDTEDYGPDSKVTVHSTCLHRCRLKNVCRLLCSLRRNKRQSMAGLWSLTCALTPPWRRYGLTTGTQVSLELFGVCGANYAIWDIKDWTMVCKH